MLPFDRYPKDRQELLPAPNRANTRREDGPRLQRLTGQTSCAYCEVDLTTDYYRWLLTSIDHVIPLKEGKRLGIDKAWCESFSNTVICCLGCNAFDNRYAIQGEWEGEDWTLDEFFVLRDRVFAERKARILERRKDEMDFFQGRPWEPPRT